MNVLSLFDGMSCGQQALERAGIKVYNYYASEIDKYAIKVTMANYPNTIQLGSVVNVDAYKLPKIDLLMGGSPCQSFSFAGKRKGMATKCETEILTLEHYLQLKTEGYEFEGQSYLFWEYMRILKDVREYNPNVLFLLENVEMGEKWETVLRKAIGVKALHINSALVSAQNRKRIYFTNIGMREVGLFGDLESIIKQPKDKGILLKDILENEVDEKYFLSEKMLSWLTKHSEKRQSEFKKRDGSQKSSCLTTTEAKQNLSNDYIIHNTMPRSSKTGKGGTGPLSRNDGNTYCLDTGNTNAIEMRGIIKFGRTEEGKLLRKESMKKGIDHTPFQAKEITGIDFNKTNCLTSVQKDNLVREVKQISTNNKSNGGTQPYQQDRIYDIDGISPALSAGKSDLMIRSLNENQLKKFNPNINSDKANTLTLAQGRAGSSEEYMDAVSKIANITSRIRRLTPIECERLQTVADNYTNHVSDSQRYKMLGNGWTVDVIAHIFSYINY